MGKIIKPSFSITAVGHILRHAEKDMRSAIFVVHNIGRNEQRQHPAMFKTNPNLGFAFFGVILQKVSHKAAQQQSILLKHILPQFIAAHAAHWANF